MVAAVLVTLCLAAAAPFIHRVIGQRTGWVLAILPATWLAWLILQAPEVRDSGVVSGSLDWAPVIGLRLAFYLDGLSLLMGVLVTAVGALVLVYTGAYFGRDKEDIGRFYAFMLAFIAAMLGLVLADNLLTLFVAWELTSVLSFLLIGFRHDSEVARRSAQQALLITGGGGLALLAGLLLVGIDSGAWELSEMRAGAYDGSGGVFAAALVLIVVGAATKSAQAPFHGWLPNAMVAPTPVSAFLHSAAMVKAGVYLLARVHPIFAESDLWVALLVPLGAVTMLLGGWFAIRETDLKRVLAYTTVSALGTMTLLLGLGNEAAVKAAVVFLCAHALYKGALFMAAGAIDHGSGTRDVRALRGLARQMPFTSLAIVVAAISMAGLPPALGYFGKETLLSATLGDGSNAVMVAAAVAGGVLAFTAASLIAVRPLFGRVESSSAHAHEGSPGLWLGPMVLAFAGLAGGAFAAVSSEWLLAPAASAIAGTPVVAKLELIPHDTTVLALSVLTISLGVASAVAFGRWGALSGVAPPSVVDRIYDALLRWLNSGSRRFVRTVQGGSLSVYVAVAITTAGLALAFPILAEDGLRRPSFQGLAPYEVALGALIIGSAAAAALQRSRMAAVAALSVVGYGVALVYASRGAPDLAMTQVLVETLTVLLFVFVFLHLPALISTTSVRSRLRDAMLAASLGVLMTAVTWTVQDADAPRELATFYSSSSVPLAHGRNVVNTILVDFRALDTLGEITVLGIAGIGVIALLRGRSRTRRPG